MGTCDLSLGHWLGLGWVPRPSPAMREIWLGLVLEFGPATAALHPVVDRHPLAHVLPIEESESLLQAGGLWSGSVVVCVVYRACRCVFRAGRTYGGAQPVPKAFTYELFEGFLPTYPSSPGVGCVGDQPSLMSGKPRPAG